MGFAPSMQRLVDLALRNREVFGVTPEGIEIARQKREKRKDKLRYLGRLHRLGQEFHRRVVLIELGLLSAEAVEDWLLKEVGCLRR